MLDVRSIDEGGDRTVVTLSVDGQAVSHDALNKALYWLAEDLSVELSVTNPSKPDEFLLVLRVEAGQRVDVPINTIRRSLVDFAVRERIESQTHRVRNEIVATALKALSRG